MARELILHTDGGSRGNPGPAAAGFVIDSADGARLAAKGFFLGETTNNVAEYTALIRALEAAEQMEAETLTVFCDSELAVRQLKGQYKVRSEQIGPLYEQVRKLTARFSDCRIQHVRREKNKEADRLVNLALDAGHDIDEMATPKVATRQKRIRLAVLISGGGRTLTNILDEIESNRLNAEVSTVICSRSTVAGVKRAQDAGLPPQIIRTRDFADIDAFSAALVRELVAAKVDLVVQAGWLCLWKIPPRYENRVMNIHPALLPSFGGKGMWGHHVHEAVLAAGCKVSGCTVHFCTNEYDAGPIIVQRTCPVEDDDTPDTLAARVFEQECLAYPQAIRWFAEERLHIEGNRVKIGP